MIENVEHKYDGDFTFIMIEMRNINMMGLYLYNDRDEEHKYDGDFTFIMIEMRNINMMGGLYLYNDRDKEHKYDGTLPL